MRYAFCLFTITLMFLNVLVQFTDAEQEAEIADVDVFYSAAITPNGRYLARGQTGAVSLETDGSETRRILIEDKNAIVNTLAFSEGGHSQMLALGTSTGAVYFYDIATKLQKADLLGTHDWGIVGLAIVPNGKLVVSTSENGNTKFWNIQTKQEVFSLEDFHKFEAPGNVTAAALSPDGTTLALGTTLGAFATDATLQLWEISRESLSPQSKKKIKIPQRTSIKTLAFSPDTKMLAAGAEDGTLFLLKLSQRVARLTTINKSHFAVTTLAFSPDSQMVVSGTENGEISFWDPYTSAKKKGIASIDTNHSQHAAAVLSMAFSDDGKTLTSVEATGTTLSWNLPGRSEPTIVQKPNKEDVVTVVTPNVQQDGTTPKPNEREAAPVVASNVQQDDTTRTRPSSNLPRIEILSPELDDANDAIPTWIGRVSVKARVTHQTGIERVTIGGLITETMRPAPTAEDANLFIGGIAFRKHGQNFFEITATAKNGKELVKRVKVNFMKDEVRPRITISELTAHSISGTVTDSESGVAPHSVKMGTQKIVLKPDGSFTYTPVLKVGDNTFTITAKDKSGNEANSEAFTLHRATTPSTATAPSTTNSDKDAPPPTTTPVDTFETTQEQTPKPPVAARTHTPQETDVPRNTAPERVDPRLLFADSQLERHRHQTINTEVFTLEFIVIDDSRINAVTVTRRSGGTHYPVSKHGKRDYEARLHLNAGENRFEIRVEDEWGNVELETVTILRVAADTEAPTLTSLSVGESDWLQQISVRGGYLDDRELILVTNETTTIRGMLSDDSGIASVNLAVNDDTAEAVAIQDGTRFEKKISLSYGRNRITIRAADTRGNADQNEFIIRHRPDRNGQDLALLFATDDYIEAGNWPDLKTAIADAEGVARKLQNTYGFRTKVIKNSTKRELMETLLDYQDSFTDKDGVKFPYQPGSQLLLYFAGHGYYHRKTDTGYLIAHDSEMPKLDPSQDTAIEHERLRKQIDLIKCDRILVMMDTCFSGTFDPKYKPRISPQVRSIIDDGTLLEQINNMLKLPARWCLTAASNEYVADGSGHSPFAAAFLEVLDTKGGQDNLLKLDEIWRKIYESRNADIYKSYIRAFEEQGKEFKLPEPRKGQFGAKSELYEESDFLLFPLMTD